MESPYPRTPPKQFPDVDFSLLGFACRRIFNQLGSWCASSLLSILASGGTVLLAMYLQYEVLGFEKQGRFNALGLYGYNLWTAVIGLPFGWVQAAAHLSLMNAALAQDEGLEVRPKLDCLRGRVLEFIALATLMDAIVTGLSFGCFFFSAVLWVPFSYLMLNTFVSGQSFGNGVKHTLHFFRYRWFLLLWLGFLAMLFSLAGILLCCVGVLVTVPCFAVVTALQWKVFQGLPLGPEP